MADKGEISGQKNAASELVQADSDAALYFLILILPLIFEFEVIKLLFSAF